MKIFADRLKQRAKDLGISNAEAARRVGLGERRYGNYTTGEREPNLPTLVKIAEALETNADYLLGISDPAEKNSRQRLLDRLTSAARALPEKELELVAVQAEALAAKYKAKT